MFCQISEQVSAQVHEEVRTLFYGNQLTVRDGSSGDAVGLPESLLRWLSQRYVSGADLQAALASMELSILQNVSLQLDQRRAPVREAVLQAAVSEEVTELTEHRFRCSSWLFRPDDVH